MIKIAIAGDFVATNRIKLYADNQQFEEILGETKAIFQNYDYFKKQAWEFASPDRKFMSLYF